jgi:hypothetical protein
MTWQEVVAFYLYVLSQQFPNWNLNQEGWSLWQDTDFEVLTTRPHLVPASGLLFTFKGVGGVDGRLQLSWIVGPPAYSDSELLLKQGEWLTARPT